MASEVARGIGDVRAAADRAQVVPATFHAKAVLHSAIGTAKRESPRTFVCVTYGKVVSHDTFVRSICFSLTTEIAAHRTLDWL